MDKQRKRLIKGWMSRAAEQLERATDHLNAQMEFSECVQACQQCIELSVKSILYALKIEYSRGHGWDRQQFSSLAKRIHHAEFIDNVIAQNLDYIRLPRLLLLARFWAQFYLPAKYEFEIGHLPPTETLLDREEAALALRHAGECYRAASQMKYLKPAVKTASEKPHCRAAADFRPSSQNGKTEKQMDRGDAGDGTKDLHDTVAHRSTSREIGASGCQQADERIGFAR